MTSNEPTTILEARPVAQVIAEYHSLHRKNLLLSVQHTTPVSHACSRLTPNNNHTHSHSSHSHARTLTHTQSPHTKHTVGSHTITFTDSLLLHRKQCLQPCHVGGQRADAAQQHGGGGVARQEGRAELGLDTGTRGLGGAGKGGGGGELTQEDCPVWSLRQLESNKDTQRAKRGASKGGRQHNGDRAPYGYSDATQNL